MTGHSANNAAAIRKNYLLSAEERQTMLDALEFWRQNTVAPEQTNPKLDAAEARLR